MQNRYVGDVGDFGKYALLRALAERTIFLKRPRLAVVWCLFPDEVHTDDGRHISYLQRHDFRALDTEVFDKLKKIVDRKERRVTHVENENIFGSGTVFFSLPVVADENHGVPTPSHRQYRGRWFDKCLHETRMCDLVFFDPDNGFETPSLNRAHRRAGKYVFFDELLPFLMRGQSLIVYHHTNRTASVEEQVRRLKGQLSQTLHSEPLALIFRRGSCRIFWILPSPLHAKHVADRVAALLCSGWRNHFRLG